MHKGEIQEDFFISQSLKSDKTMTKINSETTMFLRFLQTDDKLVHLLNELRIGSFEKRIKGEIQYYFFASGSPKSTKEW